MAFEFTVESVRTNFAIGDAKRDEGLTTPKNIVRHDDLSYGPYGKWNLLDIYQLKGTEQKQPVIVNVHGGGWVYGTKEVYQYYCMSLAQRGFTVVSFNYRLAPEAPYPASLEDINQVFDWICLHAKEYAMDPDNLFVVGDSAGAQLATQYTEILVNPDYRKLFSIAPPKELRIRAIALNCGVYDMLANVKEGGELMEAYLGTDPSAATLESLDTWKYLTKEFPPAVIVTSYYDFIQKNAKPMYEKLTELKVPCKFEMYGSEDRREVAHVFEANIRLSEATQCNDMECEFFRQWIL